MARCGFTLGERPPIHKNSHDGRGSHRVSQCIGEYGAGRAYAAATVRDMRTEPILEVLSQSRADFDAALTLYEARPDKGYSLTDCRSMVALRALGISEVLTNDHHFTQEGFTILFP